ncbi:Protein disulfide-isomerase A5 [Plecturocebus cupreus]
MHIGLWGFVLYVLLAGQQLDRWVLAGMNVHSSEFENIKEEYSVRGYPTICYFEYVPHFPSKARFPPWKGRFLFQYDNYGSTAEDIVEWLKK